MAAHKEIPVRVVCRNGDPSQAIALMNRTLLDMRLRQLGAKGEAYARCIELLNGKAPWAMSEDEKKEVLEKAEALYGSVC